MSTSKRCPHSYKAGLANLARALMPVLAILAFFQMAAMGHAQSSAISFQFPQVRVTVPVATTNTVTLTGLNFTNDSVVLLNGATNAIFDVAGLPAGVGVALTDNNNNPLASVSGSTPVWVVVNATNVPEGVYNFTLDAHGTDTNGLPVTNSIPFVLQSAYIWQGGGLGASGFGTNYNWTNAASWIEGVVPGATDDVVFADAGAQTNNTYASGIPFTNILISSSVSAGSIRFAQNTYNNAGLSANSEYHNILLAPKANLTLTGSNGLSFLRDTINDFGVSPDSTPGVFVEGLSSELSVSNPAANFSVLVGNSVNPVLNLENLGTLYVNVNRVGLSDYEVFPNYRALNAAYNAGRTADSYNGHPRRLWQTMYLARTNFITANYVNPDHYTNEYTRGYSLTVQNNEQSGNGSSVNTYFMLGFTNQFNMDSIDFIGSSSASGNSGGTKFISYNDKVSIGPGARFRNSDGVSRMSMFAASDDGGTNEADSNVKSTTDFSYASGTLTGRGLGSGVIDLLADKLYLARDRTLIVSNGSPNVQGDLIFGNGVVNVNQMYLGDQEHSNKVDWTTLYNASPYLNYCQGRLVLTNNGSMPSTVIVNDHVTLGYTADTNPSGSAQQFNTYGQITVWSNVTVDANNIICDGGLNYYDSNGRQNNINLNQGAVLNVTNTIGYNNLGASDFSAANTNGMYLDNLNMTAATLGLFANPNITNVFARNFSASGTIPSVIKVLGLTGVTSFPVQFPVISYINPSSPFLNADVSSLGANFYGYVLNDDVNNQVDLYITTNAPNLLLWTGAVNNNWDTTTKNWVTVPGGVATNFNTGDSVTFDDSSSVNGINISGSVVPSQTGIGVLITNTVRKYVFSGGTIGGTALVVKEGSNSLEFDAVEQGPINVTSGSLIGFGGVGSTTISTNATMNYSGTINGGLFSSGTVTFSGTENGPISINAGVLDNSGTMNTPGGQVVNMGVGAIITNEASATINVGALPVNPGLNFNIPHGSILANFGTINIIQPKMSVEGLLYGTGTIAYPDGGGFDSIKNTSDPRLVINSLGVLSPGPTPQDSIGNMNLYCRFDFNNDPEGPQAGIAGVSTIRIDVDFSNPQTNDIINCDRWNNDTGYLLMTNINPTAGSFALGQSFQILANSSGSPSNYIDTAGTYPTMVPYVPGPGLQWGLSNFSQFGSISIVKSPNVWDGVASANWSTNSGDTSWKVSQTYSDDQGAVFDDTASGSTTVNLTDEVAPDGYSASEISPNVTPGIVVDNNLKDYVIAGTGEIGGITGLYKTGTGNLTLLTKNIFTGDVIVDQGTLTVSNYPGSGSIVALGVAGAGQMENDVILDGGTLNYAGNANVNFSIGKGEGLVLGGNNGTVNVLSATNSLLFNKNVTGTGSLTLNGPGTVILTSASDNYPGGTTVNDGQVELMAAGLGFGPLVLNNSAGLILDKVTVTNEIEIAGPSTTLTVVSNTQNVIAGPVMGGGEWICSSVGTTDLQVFSGDMSGFTGVLELGNSVGVFEFNNSTNSNLCTGSAAASFDLGTGSAVLDNYNGENAVYNLGSLAGGPNTVLSGRSSGSFPVAGTTYSIGANGQNATFAGTISNGLDTVSINKVGSGIWYLNGNNTYTGATTVSGGTLAGVGSIASPLTLGASATLAPGASPTTTGTFTVSNSASIQGPVVLKLNQAGIATSNDEVAVTGTLTVSGPLVVNSIGGTLVNGTTFHLFNQAVTGFSSITLPTGGGAYSWATNLAVDGSIKLLSGGTVSLAPVRLTTSLSGGVLSISWPADHLGWKLETETNTLSVGISSNWVVVPGSTTVTNVPVNVDPTAPTVFYRLVSP